ncbi:hypothetical protein FB451DRAFT_1203962 [Mycena latifolia]|nr:hypothetical protein FB451DRAFT_1203962 [Mycena latifolia]
MSSRLYLKNLPSVAYDDVLNYLERFGRLTELKIFETESFSYGFAQFSSEEDAKYVLDTFHGRLFLGHSTVIEPARPLRKDMPFAEPHSSRSSDSRTRTHGPRYGSIRPKYYPNRAYQCRYPVLVENIPRHICWQELKDFGRLSGRPVAYCEVDRKKNGHGFIEYLSQEDAEEAIRALNGQKLGGRSVALAHPKTHRRPSRSRSPIRRPSHHTRAPPSLETKDARRGHSAFPTSASRYSLRTSPERFSSQDRFTSPPYSLGPALSVDLHPDLHTFSKAVDSYRTRLFGETAASERALVLPTSSSIDSFESVPQTAAESNDYYNFDQYLRLTYDRNRLEYLPGCFS